VKKEIAQARTEAPSLLDTVFAGGCAAIFLTIVASLAGVVSLYLR
jgi:hypothetical protein